MQRTLTGRFCVGVLMSAALSACSELTAPEKPSISASLYDLFGCGFEQLRAPSPGTEVTLGGAVARLSTPVRSGVIYGVPFTAPQQWHGTNSPMYTGTIYSTGFDSSRGCTMAGGTELGTPIAIPIEADSAAAALAPDGVDPFEFSRLPAVVRELIWELATKLANAQSLCQMFEETCLAYREGARRAIFNAFKEAQSTALAETALAEQLAWQSGKPLTYAERTRMNAFFFGCELQGELHTGGMEGRVTSESAIDLASRLGGSMISTTLWWGYGYIRPGISSLVLAGANRGYLGDDCRERGLEMLNKPLGENYIRNGGLSGGGGEGGGGTQF